MMIVMATFCVLMVVCLHTPAHEKKGRKSIAHGMLISVPNYDIALWFNKIDCQCLEMKGTGPSMSPL